MPYDPAIHHRRSIRLRGYDYAQAGAYFVTLVTQGRECLFGEIVEGVMRLNDAGEIARAEWEKSAEIRREIELDAFVVMPNHIHGIVVIVEPGTGGADGRPPLPDMVAPEDGGRGRPPLPRKQKSLGAFIAGFKSAATKRINEVRVLPGVPVWQRNYCEHVVRNETDLTRIRAYIANNPLAWASDSDNSIAKGNER
jgi:putative transposase